MRRSAIFLVFGLLILVMTALSGCGGGSKSTTNTAARVTLSPDSASMDPGGVLGLTASVQDSNGNLLNTATVTYSSSNTALATVSDKGSVCAGTWDANFVVCTPGGTGVVTISAKADSAVGTATFYVHQHVDVVVLDSLPASCVSMGGTQQMRAHAYHNTGPTTPPLDITATVGPFSWATGSPNVAQVDTNGVVTAKSPGGTNVYAAVSGVTSTPAVFTVCAVQSIHLHVSGSPNTSFSLPLSSNQQLTADIVDTSGAAITPQLQWNSSLLATMGVTQTGLANSIVAGASGITAICEPPACNQGLPGSPAQAIYSNVVLGTVAGTSATTVYATGTGTTSLVPIDTTTNTAGTAVTLAATPNSFLIDSSGTRGFLGTASGLIVVTLGNNSVAAPLASFPGTVIAVSPDGARVLVASGTAVYVFGTSTSTASETLSISGATAAAFTPDSAKAFIVAGNNLYVYTPGTALKIVSLPAAAKTTAMLASGAFGYLGGASAGLISVAAACNNNLVANVVTPGAPSLMQALPDGSGVLAVDSPGIDVITAGSNNAGCPPTVTNTVASKDFGQGAFAARQLLLTSNGTSAYVLSNLGVILRYNSDGSVASIPLAGGANASTGGLTLDGTRLYVGGSDNNVHRIDTVAGTDAQQISVSFTPNLVAVRPH